MSAPNKYAKYRSFRKGAFCALFALICGGRLDVPHALAVEGSGSVPVVQDSDGDGLSDVDELAVYHTDPNNSDTDGDGYPDGLEVQDGYSPRRGNGQKLLDMDSDGDYLNDAWEIAAGTDLLNPDTDGDRYLDGTEVAAGYDPLSAAPVRLAKKIDVSLKNQELEYWFGDRLFGAFKVSTGIPGMPTPPGEYLIQEKVPVKHYGGNGYDYPNTKWNLLFTRRNGLGYYIHGAYWHNAFGTRKSHGCVNVSYANMEPLYWWAQVGTQVSIH